MHGLDPNESSQAIADTFVAQALTNAVKTPDNVFEGLSWG
jgi:hypothetical protein